MAKRKPVRPGVEAGIRAARLGPSPHSRIVGGVSMKGIPLPGSHIGLFPSAKKPKVGRNKPLYPGFDIWQRLKTTTGGPAGTTDPRDL